MGVGAGKSYLETLCTEDALLKRAKNMAKKIGADRPLNPTFENQTSKDCYNLLNSTQEMFFDQRKKHFFMMDIYKGNEQRFKITFDQCKHFSKGNGP